MKINIFRLLSILLILSVFQVCESYGEGDIDTENHRNRNSSWQITATSLSYSEKDSVYIAKGDVVITKENQTFSSDEAIYNKESGIVQIKGNVRFESDGDFLTGDSGIFNLNDQTGKIINGQIFISKNNYYISGDVMEKLPGDSYLVKNCHITTCDSEKPAWSITGSEVKVTIEGYGKVKNAALRVRETPIFYVPYMIFPAKTKRQSGFLPPGLGYSDRNGSEMEIPFFWAISNKADMTFYERIMSQRGIMQGLEYRYKLNIESEGLFMLDILSDNIDKDLNNPYDAEISPFERTNETRYWFRGRADQAISPGFTARLDADFVSDQDYLHEFHNGLNGFSARPDLANESGRPLEERTSPTRRSALRLSYDDQNYSLQAITAYHQRPENPLYDDTPQPIGGLDFSLLPATAVKNIPVSFSFDTDYDYIWRDFGQKGHRMSLTPEISYPMWIGRYFEFEPSAGFIRNMQWLDDNPYIDRQSRDAYQFQTRLTSSMERIFDFSWRDVTKLKHKFSPSLKYRYHVPEDEEKPKPWFEPIDAEGKINTITLSLDNYIDAKRESENGIVSYHEFASFSVNQSYDIDENDRDEAPWIKKEPFKPLTGILSVSPFSDLDINTEVRWDHYDKAFSYTDLSLEFSVDRKGGRRDNYSLDYEYQKNGDKNLNYSMEVYISHGYAIGTSLIRDLNLDYNLSQSYWIEYLSQCWGIRLTAGELDDASTIMLTFRLTGLGDSEI